MSSAATIAGSPASSTTRAETAIAGSVRGRRARSGSPLVRLSCCRFGAVRNLVCGAIVTPMEGAYGNQERHPGRFAGGAGPAGCFRQGRAIRRAKESFGGARFERGDRRPSGRRGGGGEAQQPQRLFEEEG